MRPAVKTAIGIIVVIVVIVIAILGWRAATRTPEPPAPGPTSTTSPSEGQPSSPATPSEPTESTAPDGDVPETAAGVDALVRTIPDRQWRRIVSTGTWRPECPVGRSDLRRIELNYRTFDGEVKRGHLIAHKDTVDDLVEVFSALFEAGFPIQRMKPVERYGGEVLRSLEANNTSAFNCRKPGQINAPVKDSPHANGRAIDINPVQNPWRDPRCKCWQPGREFAKAKDGPGVIREDSLPVQLFEERGWVWQNIKVPDYMHFDTGYPSRSRSVEGESDRES
jgi:hypothetical protein